MPDIPSRLQDALEDRYRIERPLGSGGMADVYLAHDVRHDRPVALKVLKSELAAMVGAERFLAEIRTTARLQHPHVLPLHDSGDIDGILFYVMPYVDGESLRDRLERERQLPVEDAVRITRQLAEALDYAHRQGVVHRDLKPANVLMLDGNPVLADFGIALAVGAAGGGRLTETGLSLGTPHYMSPEQATGDGQIGPAADLYALGCILFEMLAGRPPFVAGTAQAVLGKILTEEVPAARKERPAVPLHVDAVIATALEKVPADRFRTGADFASALGDPGFRRVAPGEDTSRAPLLRAGTLATIGLTALVTAVGVGLLRDGAGAPPSFQIVALDLGALAGSDEVRLSPDGRRLVAEADGRLWARRLSDFDWTPLPGTEGAVSPRWSPESEMVVFTSGDQVRTVPVDGGPASTLFRLPEPCSWEGICGATWGWDGRIWAATGVSDVLAGPEDGGALESVLAATDELHHHLPLALPGGALLLAIDYEEGGTRPALWDGESIRPLEGLNFPAAYGDGWLYHQRGSEIWATPWSEDALDFSGPAEFVAPDATLRSAGGNGSILAAPARAEPEWRRELVWVDRDGRETGDVQTSLSGEGRVDAIALSREGRLLWRDDNALWYSEAGARFANPVPSSEEDRPVDGVWVPGAEAVVLDVVRRGLERHEAPIVRADLSTRTVTEVVPRGKHPTVSFDGRYLAFETGDVGEGRVQILDLTSGVERPLASGLPSETRPALSPAAPWIAYLTSDGPGAVGNSLWVARMPGGSDPTLLERDVAGAPRWSRDGSRLYFSQDGILQELRLDLSGDRPVVVGLEYLFSTGDDGVAARSVLPDSAGTRFLLGGLQDGAGTDNSTLMLIQNRGSGG